MELLGMVEEPVWSEKSAVDPDHAMDGEWWRCAYWHDDDADVSLVVTAWVVGIRCRKHADGSWTMLGVMSRFDVLKDDEFVQPVERAVFLWDRTGPDGKKQSATDYVEDIGVWYQGTPEQAMEVCRQWITGFDVEAHCDPTAWPGEPA